MPLPVPNLRPYRLARLVRHRRTEVDEVLPLPVLRPPGPKRLSQKVGFLVWVRPSPILSLARDHRRRLRMKLQPAFLHARSHGGPYLLGLRLCPTMHACIVGIPCTLQVRIGFPPPHVEGVVQKQIRQQGTKYTSYKVANFLVEFSTSIPRTQLRPSYGDGFLGAPLQSSQPLENPAPREQGDQRGSSSTQRQQNSGGAHHL